MPESFVYKWTNVYSGKFYIGKHKGNPNDGYISSGKTFLACYHLDPQAYTREILFYGTDRECLKEESRLIKQSIDQVGYQGIYNRTSWELLKGWKRTCLHCGAVCDPRNIEWAEAFELNHFENCNANSIKIKPLTNKEWRLLRDQKIKPKPSRKLVPRNPNVTIFDIMYRGRKHKNLY